ncbi:MAG TPA: hypothetical protein VMF12_16230 [Xanthobacteraceae bacterium]|nr:hypothetical protein [Xanthobacteraceae bacterium]
MRMRNIAFVCGVLGLGLMASPALAGCDGLPGDCFWAAHHAIYHKENHIALLQSDPMVGEGYKGPIIDHLHRKILRIRATVGMRWPHWPAPCCYSRRPIYIR